MKNETVMHYVIPLPSINSFSENITIEFFLLLGPVYRAEQNVFKF